MAIPERHTRKGDEHLGLVAKQEAGCSYFVTQVVYDVNAAKNLVSDYAYECRDRGLDPVPIVFTMSVCGSMKTLEFLRWLGVDVPRWIENDLRHAEDTLDASLEHAEATALELMSFCRRLGVPFGINVESVSIRKWRSRQACDWQAGLALRSRADPPARANGRRASLHPAQLAAQRRKQAEGALAAHGGWVSGSRVMRGFPDTHFSRGALSRRGSSSTGTGACASSTARRCRPGWRHGRRRLTRQRAR